MYTFACLTSRVITQRGLRKSPARLLRPLHASAAVRVEDFRKPELEHFDVTMYDVTDSNLHATIGPDMGIDYLSVADEKKVGWPLEGIIFGGTIGTW